MGSDGLPRRVDEPRFLSIALAIVLGVSAAGVRSESARWCLELGRWPRRGGPVGLSARGCKSFLSFRNERRQRGSDVQGLRANWSGVDDPGNPVGELALPVDAFRGARRWLGGSSSPRASRGGAGAVSMAGFWRGDPSRSSDGPESSVVVPVSVAMTQASSRFEGLQLTWPPIRGVHLGVLIPEGRLIGRSGCAGFAERATVGVTLSKMMIRNGPRPPLGVMSIF